MQISSDTPGVRHVSLLMHHESLTLSIYGFYTDDQHQAGHWKTADPMSYLYSTFQGQRLTKALQNKISNRQHNRQTIQ